MRLLCRCSAEKCGSSHRCRRGPRESAVCGCGKRAEDGPAPRCIRAGTGPCGGCRPTLIWMKKQKEQPCKPVRPTGLL